MRTPARILLAGLSVLSFAAQASAGENWHAGVSFEAAKTAASADKAWFRSKPVVTPERRAEIKNLNVADLKTRAKAMLDSLAPQFSGRHASAIADWTDEIWNNALALERRRDGSFQRCYQLVSKDSSQPYARIIVRVKACSDIHDLRRAYNFGTIVSWDIEGVDVGHPSGMRAHQLASGWAIAMTLEEFVVLEDEYALDTGLSREELEIP